jgi:hypothetical protein
MNAKALADMVSRRPYRTLTIRMANGSRVRVTDPDRVALHPEGSVLVIFDADGGLRILDLPLMAEITTK